MRKKGGTRNFALIENENNDKTKTTKPTGTDGAKEVPEPN